MTLKIRSSTAASWLWQKHVSANTWAASIADNDASFSFMFTAMVRCTWARRLATDSRSTMPVTLSVRGRSPSTRVRRRSPSSCRRSGPRRVDEGRVGPELRLTASPPAPTARSWLPTRTDRLSTGNLRSTDVAELELIRCLPPERPFAMVAAHGESQRLDHDHVDVWATGQSRRLKARIQVPAIEKGTGAVLMGIAILARPLVHGFNNLEAAQTELIGLGSWVPVTSGRRPLIHEFALSPRRPCGHAVRVSDDVIRNQPDLSTVDTFHRQHTPLVRGIPSSIAQWCRDLTEV